MKKLGILLSMCLLLLCCNLACADTAVVAPEVPPVPGWGPSVVGSVGAFYLNGNYSLLAAGVNVGAAYTFTDPKQNVNSIGSYAGPSSQLVNGVTTTAINTMVYLNLYQTATIGGFGVGVGTRLWQSGEDMKRAVTTNTTFIALGYKF